MITQRESAPRDLRVARGFRRRPRVAFPRAGAERRPMRDLLSATLCEMGGATGERSPGERSPVCLWTLVRARRARRRAQWCSIVCSCARRLSALLAQSNGDVSSRVRAMCRLHHPAAESSMQFRGEPCYVKS